MGWSRSFEWGVVEQPDFTFMRVEFKEFHLSQVSALYLLQGASLKMLFSDVVTTLGDGAADVFSLVAANAPRLYDPSPTIKRVVLAHILERPADLSPETVFERLFMLEAARTVF